MTNTAPSRDRIQASVPSLLLGLGCLLSSGLACQGALQEDEIASQQQHIVNGTVSEGDTAVVALVYHGSQFCTGTLVGKRTVVTAAHCLPPHVDVPMFGIEVYFGSNVAAEESKTIRVVDAIANPDWNPNVVAGDVGVLALASDAPVEPMAMAYLDVTASGMLGEDARAVGFGVTAADGNGNGTRRSGMLTVDRYDASSIYLRPGPSATCNGDSGGALIFMQDGVEVLGGIHSRSDCNSAIIAERVDVHAMNFVMPFIEEHEGEASCDSDGLCASGCGDEPDPDCPCVADGICSDVCAHPSADLDCSSACPADGTCDESCEYDYDCTADTEALCEGDECESTDGGCSTGGSSSSTWALFGLLFLFLRRRRN